jgi:hypothetical protein
MTLDAFILRVRYTHTRPDDINPHRWHGMMRYYLNRLDSNKTLTHGVVQDAINDTCFWHRQRETA